MRTLPELGATWENQASKLMALLPLKRHSAGPLGLDVAWRVEAPGAVGDGVAVALVVGDAGTAGSAGGEMMRRGSARRDGRGR